MPNLIHLNTFRLGLFSVRAVAKCFFSTFFDWAGPTSTIALYSSCRNYTGSPPTNARLLPPSSSAVLNRIHHLVVDPSLQSTPSPRPCPAGRPHLNGAWGEDLITSRLSACCHPHTVTTFTPRRAVPTTMGWHNRLRLWVGSGAEAHFDLLARRV
jgi:hypothetical protein